MCCSAPWKGTGRVPKAADVANGAYPSANILLVPRSADCPPVLILISLLLTIQSVQSIHLSQPPLQT